MTRATKALRTLQGETTRSTRPAGARGAAERPGDGRSGRRADTRAVIVESALGLFARNGVSATSVEDVAAAAGVAKGSVYYNFGSKAGLVEAMFERYLADLRGHLVDAIGERTGWEAASAAIAALLWRVEANPELAKLLAAEIFRTDRDWHETLRLLRDQIVALVARALADGQEQGTVDPRLSPDVAAVCLFGATLTAGLDWRLFAPERSLDEVVESVRTVVLARGLG